MSSSIVVEFEVLPDDLGSTGDRTAQQVCAELQRQLADPGSLLRTGEFGRFASGASLNGPGLPEVGSVATENGGGAGFGGMASYGGDTLRSMDEAAFGSAAFGSGSGTRGGGGGMASSHTFDHQGPYGMPMESSRAPAYGGTSEWAGLSNADLVDRISQLEHQLQRTAAGGGPGTAGAPGTAPGIRQDLPPSMTLRSQGMAPQALEDKCLHLQQRLEAMEKELREAQEAARMFRQRYDQCELKLKDREQLLVHAKEMWMKENVRASKLADALTTAEDKIADQEKRLGEVVERYNDAQGEVRALQHLVGTNPDGAPGDHFSFDKKNGRMPATSGELSMSGSRNLGTGHSFETSFGGRDSMAGSTRALPSTATGLADNGRALPFMPMDAETNTDRFRRLCLVNDAILYEDELLQIGVKAEYAGMEGQMAVFFGNKGGASLHAFTVQYFVKEEKALRLSASPLNQQLDSDKQVIQRITAVMQEPFVEPPVLRIQFLLPDTSPRTIQLKLPIVLTKFMVGRDMTPQDFFQQWRQQHFVLNEATSIVHLASRFRGALVQVARSIVFGGALRMHHGIDTNPDNFVLVGQLCEQGRPAAGGHDYDADRSRGVFGVGSDREHGLSLVRVEVGSGRFVGKARVVVRSSDHVVARALCDGIVAQLAEANAPQSDGAVAR